MGTSDESAGAAFDERLGASDAVLWDIEKDPVLRSTITAVALLDRSPDWDRLRRRLEHGSHEVPRLRQRVAVPPLRAGAPRWVDDTRFDLDYHLRRVRAPEGVGDDPLRAALDVAQPIAMAPFDRARPLWEFTLVEGLPGGRAAFVQKVHHTVTDGVGGVRLALMLVDEHRDAPEPDERERAAPRYAPSGLALLATALGETVLDAGRNLARVPGAAAGGVRGLARRPFPAVRDAARLGGSVVKLVRPVTEPCSPLMRERSLARRLEAFEVPVESLRAAGHAAGGHLNDAFLAGVVGGVAD